MPDISLQEFHRGCEAFQLQEKRDAMYKTATFLVEHFWHSPCEIADGLGVLLLTWNHAFYRYGLFDFDKLERCIADNQDLLDIYRHRDILGYSSADDPAISRLFEQFLEALQIESGKSAGRQSPVGVAKALHLLAPAFFPLWDEKIARYYDCRYVHKPTASYIAFFRIMYEIAGKLQPHVNLRATGKTLLKLIDEYNYAKCTKQWI